MHWILQGKYYVNGNGEKVTLQQFPFVVSVGDTVEKFGTTYTVSNIFYMENGSVVLEMTSLSEEV